jgi:hypothetical protein
VDDAALDARPVTWTMFIPCSRRRLKRS